MNNSIKCVITNLTPKLDLLDLFEFFLHFMAKSGVDSIWRVDSARLNILALGRDITLYCHIETDVNETFCFVTFRLTTPFIDPIEFESNLDIGMRLIVILV